MAYNVSALTAYTEQNNFPLITSSVFQGKTISLLTPQLGIKSSEALNIIETDAVFQLGGTCGFNASGTTSLSQRVITVGKIKINEALCPKTLEAYYTQTQLPSGSRYESLPFEQVYAEKKAGKIAEALETAVWQGDTDSNDSNLKRFDGLIKIIDAASTVVTASTSTINATNIRTIIKDIYTKVPSQVIDKEDLRCFMGWDTFRTLINKLTDDNLFHYTTDSAAGTGELTYPGTTLKIVAVHGLDGTNRIFVARLSNLYFGTDMMNEEERFEIFFAKEADEIRFVAEFKAGTQIAFPAEIVSYKNA